MHKITALALFVLVASASACSSGGRTDFVDDIAAPSESAADVSHPMTEEEVVEAIKEDIVARETEAEVPVALVETPSDAENVSNPMSGELPEGTGPQTTPETQVDEAQVPDIGTAPQSPPSEDDGTVSAPARAAGTLTPANPGSVLVDGKEEYEVKYGFSATAEPYTPPVEYESPGFSATYTPQQPESNRLTLPNAAIHCILTDCE